MGAHWANEFDAKTAAWHRQLAADGLIAPVEVDERSIEDVAPAELVGRPHVHFFAGIGGWAHALDLAGWPRDRPVWTGSCPCQPYSQAGAGGGDDDPRALWWAMRWHIAQCGPAVVFGEQVAGPAGAAWLSGLRADLGALGYAVGAACLPAAGVAAPHPRHRVFWVAVRLADAGGAAGEWHTGGVSGAQAALDRARQRYGDEGDRYCHGGDAVRLADAEGIRREWRQGTADGCVDDRPAPRRPQGDDGPAGGHDTRTARRPGAGRLVDADRHRASAVAAGGHERPGTVHGGWADADWLFCRDDRWRPVEPGTFPLADGIPARVVQLRGYGNAIVPELAAAFVAAVMDVLDGRSGPDWLDWEGGA